MFSDFAANYEKTLKKLVDQTAKYQLNAAKRRQKIGKNVAVENVSGRELHHFLIKQMKDTSAWQLHLKQLKDELAVQEDKWEHREEEKAEIERKREEIRLLEEEYERERSLSRRRNMEIVHEDQMDQHPEEEKK